MSEQSLAVKTIYIHAGNPKAFSTSLQYIFADNHEKNINYNGFIPQNEVDDWYSNKHVSAFLNYDLRISSKRSFEKNVVFYRDFFHELMESTSLDNCLSSENILMRFTMSEIEVEEKLERLSRVMDNICHINLIGIFRPILSSCYSIYLEYLKQGYTRDFTYFQAESRYLADSNFIDSLFPAFTEKLCSRFPNITFSYICASTENLNTVLKIGFEKFLPKLRFNTAPHLNSSKKNAAYMKGRYSNRSDPDFVDSLGILENHRILWHELNQDDLKWGKLRALRDERRLINSEITEVSVPRDFRKDFRDFIGHRWLEYSDESFSSSGCCIAGDPRDLRDFNV